MALKVNPDGTAEEITIPPSEEGDDRLSVMQEAVNGLIQPVYIEFGDYSVILINEEGLLLNLEPNIVASMAAQQPIVGPVLFLTGDEWDATS